MTKKPQNTFTLSAANIETARIAATVKGFNFASLRNQPGTLERLDTACNQVSRLGGAGIAAACGAAVMVGADSPFTSNQLFASLRFGLSKTELADQTGGNAAYDAAKRARNLILRLAVTGDVCATYSEIDRVDLETGTLREKARRQPKAKGSPKGKGKTGGAVTKPIGVAHNAEGKPCTNITQGNVKRVMKADAMAAFIADLTTLHMVTLECEDSDLVANARDQIDGLLTRVVSDICAD